MKLFIRYLLVSSLMSGIFFWSTFPDGKLHIVICDVGQGDAVFLMQGFTQVLIDGGPDDSVIDCLSDRMPWFDSTIEVVVLTHPHLDHLGGLSHVLSLYTIRLFVATDAVSSSRAFESLADLVRSKQIQTISPQATTIFSAGAMSFTPLLPQEMSLKSGSPWNFETFESGSDLQPYSGDLNATSIVLRMDYKDISMLLTGDISTKEEQALITQGVITPVDVLKVAHHGSKYSSSDSFLELLAPKWALVSVGKTNRYGHPSTDVLMRLDAVGAKIFRTDENGEIELVSDGKIVQLYN